MSENPSTVRPAGTRGATVRPQPMYDAAFVQLVGQLSRDRGMRDVAERGSAWLALNDPFEDG